MGKRSPQDIQGHVFKFGVRVIELVNRMPRTLAGETLAKQLIRSGISIGANMQEADGAETKRDFIHKVSIAHKEARESRYWLAIIQASIMKGDSEVAALWQEADELVRILFTIINDARQTTTRPVHTR